VLKNRVAQERNSLAMCRACVDVAPIRVSPASVISNPRIGGAGSESRTAAWWPWTSFSENEVLPDGSRPTVWFAFDETRPLAFFAGIWTRWTSVRKGKEGETTNVIFAILTTEPNKEVGAIHPKAMPVVLTAREKIDVWMNAPAEEALKLQRPLPDNSLKIVARGDKKDEGGLAA
jgi:putative SOS response-associated peptidase YedK